MRPRPQARGLAAAAGLIVIAAIATMAPLPPERVERLYSRGIYPAIQRALTPATNLVPIAVLDVAALALLAYLVLRFIRAGRGKAGARAVAVTLVKSVAVVYVLFLVLWGLNYRRVPLAAALDFDPGRVTEERTFALAAESVRRVNALHANAHAIAANHGLDRSSLESALGAALRALDGRGFPRDGDHLRTGRPKWSLLGHYFRYAAIDGMTNPLFLEVILNPDLLAVERPEVLAHEWAHLAGYAEESDANFVAWLTCLRGDALAQYSGWLSAYGRAASVLPRERRAALPRLDEGPREDLAAIAARYGRSSPAVRKAAREVYDSYLKANRVEEGIASYDRVLRLMLGTTLGNTWTPR
jgi:hypothetical protein